MASLHARRRHVPTGGALELFSDRRVSYSFNTRVAIRKACDLIGLRPGDDVLAPAYNCGSELDPLVDAGLGVRLYGVDRQAMVEPGAIARLIGPRTRAVYLTHYFGVLQPATVAIRALCDVHGLRLIEDCALSLLSGPDPAGGRVGDVAVFCFYKFFPVIGGGALVVNAPDLPDPPAFARPAPVRLMARHLARMVAAGTFGQDGIDALRGMLRRGRTAGGAETGHAARDRFPDMPGHYYFDPRLRDTRVSGLTVRALARVDVAGSIRAHQMNHARLQEALTGVPGIAPLFPRLDPYTVPLGMPVLVAGGHRNGLARALQAEGIAATPWWAGYNRRLDFAHQPEACALKDSVLFLPVRPPLDQAAMDRIASRTAALLASLR